LLILRALGSRQPADLPAGIRERDKGALGNAVFRPLPTGRESAVAESGPGSEGPGRAPLSSLQKTSKACAV